LLASREDVFSNYTEEGFVEAFSGYFKTEQREPIRESQRVLYRLAS